MKQTVKVVLKKWETCQKYHGKPYFPVDAMPLPQFRINISKPFCITGVDFTGALKFKGEANEFARAYIVLFTCATTRAIDL